MCAYSGYSLVPMKEASRGYRIVDVSPVGHAIDGRREVCRDASQGRKGMPACETDLTWMSALESVQADQVDSLHYSK